MSLVGPAWGQSSWPSYPNNTAISVTSSGNVGIGTSAPNAALHVVGGGLIGQFTASANPALYLQDNSSGGFLGLAVASGGGAYLNGVSAKDALLFSPFNTGGIALGTGSTVRLYVTLAGNVGIGTTSPQHLLHVAGTIGAEEVIVSSTGADYVFDPGYKLQPLSEVADYIKENHHLPDIPAAAEMKEKGADLGEMQTKLLAKIEELTLHQIQLEQQNKDLQQQIRALQQQVRREGRPSNNDGGF